MNGWLNYLLAENTFPYENAATMLHFSTFARMLNKVQAMGHQIGIISWTSKGGNENYNLAVEMAKRAWLARHLPSVEWDEIKIVRYGTNKWYACGDGILFDDEEKNRMDWQGEAYTPSEILTVLHTIINGA